jgi:hypothetical protein
MKWLPLSADLLCGMKRGMGEKGAGCGVALRAAFPWRGEAGAALGCGARPAAVASPASVREEEEGVGWASSDKKAEWVDCFRGRKEKTWVGRACYGCWAEYRKRKRKGVFLNFWLLKWVNSKGILNFE